MEYVYFFRETSREFVKIGCSKNSYLDRFASFKTYSPLGAYVVGVIETNNCISLESLLHKEFSKKRVKGEFFKLTDDECYQIIKRYDKSFGEIFSLTNDLIKNYGLDKKEIYKLLQRYILINSKDINQEIPNSFKSIISDLQGQELTNTEIKEILKKSDINLSNHKIGNYLKLLGFENKVKKINGKVKRVYNL